MKNEKNEKRVLIQNSNEAKKILTAADVISKFATANSGLLKSNLGVRKSSIYRENLFSGANDKEKKSLRKKFRNMLLSLSETIVSEKNSDKLNKLVNNFNDFYCSCYILNDYSLSSVCQENLATEKKNILQKALQICKAATAQK